jgi:hypothetical protein
LILTRGVVWIAALARMFAQPGSQGKANKGLFELGASEQISVRSSIERAKKHLE